MMEKHAAGRALALSALINLAALIVYAVLMKPYFLSNDDATMRFVADGTRIAYDTHLVYQNVILGWVYHILYAITRRFPWYTLVQWGSAFAALTALGYLFLERLRRLPGVVLTLTTTGIIGYECYIRMQYTRTCAVLTAAGMLLLYKALCRQKQLWPEIAAGFALGTLGALYRFPVFLASGFLTTGCALYPVLRWMKHRGGLRRSLRLVGASAGMVMLAVLLAGADRLAYRSEDWQYYVRFNDARTALLDYGMPDYKTYRERYEALGIDKTAFSMLRTWNFADPEVFSAEALEEIGSWKDEMAKPSFEARLQRFFERVPEGLTHRRALFYAAAAFAALLAAFLAGGGSRRRDLPLLLGGLYTAAAFCGLYFVTYLRGRYLVEWVDAGLLFAAGLSMWSLTAASDSGECEEADGAKTPEPSFGGAQAVPGAKKGPVLRDLLLCGICAAGVLVMVLVRSGEFYPMLRTSADAVNMQMTKTGWQNRLMEAAGDKEHLYLFMMGTLSDDDCFGPFDMAAEGAMNNLLWMGGWSTWSGLYLQTARAFGISNPYRDMIDNDRVLLVDTSVEETLTYLRTHYDESVRAERFGNLGDYPVYRIVTK